MINRATLALAAAGAALLTGACGSGDDNKAGDKPKADPQAAALKFARCMRSNGINIPDPTFSGNGGIQIRGPRGKGKPGFDPDAPTFKAAQKACSKYLEAATPQMTPAQEAEAQQRALQMFKCLRTHGVDIPDSAASGGRVRFGPDTGVNPDSPTFQRAMKACANKGGPGGPGGFSVQSEGGR